jgi:membrane fusion protein (multidrug efflux system)
VASAPLKAKESEPNLHVAEGAHPPASTQEPAKPRRKRPLAIVAALALLAAGGFGAHALFTQGKESTDDAQIEADVIAVAPEVGGRVARVLVKDNQRVKQGDVLLELDDQELRAKLDQAKAELATANAELRSARAQELIVSASASGSLRTAKAAVSGSALSVASADSQVEAAKATVARAEADAKRAALELRRTEELFSHGAIPQEQFDNAKLASDAAEAALTQARAGLSAAEDMKRVAQSHVAEAQGRLVQSTPVDAQIEVAHAATELASAHVKAAESRVALAEIELGKARVTAAADGVVSRLTAREGQLLSPRQPVAELVPNQAYVVANFKETQLAGIAPGKPAEVSVDAYPGRSLHGVVESLSGGTGARFSLLPPDNASGNFVKVVQRVPVRIALTDAPRDLPLRAGLSAEATVITR